MNVEKIQITTVHKTYEHEAQAEEEIWIFSPLTERQQRPLLNFDLP